MPPQPPPFRLVGARREVFRDLFHGFLSASWVVALGAIVGVWLGLNALFATGFWAVGGVAHMRPGDWRDAFFFSVQTMGTIGYGVMAPETDAANVLVTLETMTGLVTTAVATGLVFAKFGRTAARVRFAAKAVIAEQDGVRTLSVRVGNERLNRIVDVRFRLTLVRTERTREGSTFYRMYDLELARAQASELRSAYTLHHRIQPGTLLAGYDPAGFAADECELNVVVTGLDETTLQPVHASQVYLDRDVAWGARYADMLREQPDGTIEVDLRRFHEIEEG
jgi:inward rectifier potassium channel